MVLQLTFNDLLRLQDARGAAIEVLDGKVWITEHGRPSDLFLERGRAYRVAGSGLVVVGAEDRLQFARIQVRKPARGLLGWVSALVQRYAEARDRFETRRELAALSDHALKDIGLRRDQVY